MQATKIKMKMNCENSNSVEEIDKIYLIDCQVPGYYTKSAIYDYLIANPGTIIVGKYPFPKLIPALSAYGEKYVKSAANNTERDNLLNLPRE